jgi:carbonic anhydrase/acetyltransferase-like protein (isoleucine patch superfamily)
MNLRAFAGTRPTIDATAYIDPQCALVGRVEVGAHSSVWPFVAARGDVNFIRIGARSNIQDGSILHVTHDGPYTPGGIPLLIGDDVTVGHGAILHACTIEDASLIGMGATVLDGAHIGKHCMIGAGSLVSPGKTIEPGSLWLGNPARFVRKLSDAEIQMLYYSAKNYVRLAAQYLADAQLITRA